LILVVRDGEIAERGTYTDLVARGGIFARLHATQFVDETPAPPALARRAE